MCFLSPDNGFYSSSPEEGVVLSCHGEGSQEVVPRQACRRPEVSTVWSSLHQAMRVVSCLEDEILLEKNGYYTLR